MRWIWHNTGTKMMSLNTLCSRRIPKIMQMCGVTLGCVLGQ